MRGRPKAKLDLPEGWQEMLTALYADGASDAEVKAEIRSMRGTFSNDLFDRWLADEPEFSETIKNGRTLAEAWWMKQARTPGAIGNGFINPTAWIFNMKNRFGWADRREVKTEGTVRHVQELTDAELADLATGSGEGIAVPPSSPPEPTEVH